MDKKELGRWLHFHYYKFVVKGQLTQILWDDLSEEDKLGWYKLAEEMKDNYLELFVYGGI